MMKVRRKRCKKYYICFSNVLILIRYVKRFNIYNLQEGDIMKKRVLCFMLLGMMLMGNTVSYAAETGAEQPQSYLATYDEDTWNLEGKINFPITADDQTWSQFQSHDEMVMACNMPSKLVEEASTEELVNLMLEYPLLGDLMLYDNVEVGLEIMSRESNILAELLSRDDGATELLNAYSDFEVKDISSLSQDALQEIITDQGVLEDYLLDDSIRSYIEQDEENLVQNVFFETVLTRENVVDKLTDGELTSLVNEVEEKVAEKESSEVYSAYTYLFYEMAEQAGTIDDLDVSSIVARDTSATIKTPNGSSVAVVKRTYSASESASAYNYTVTNYPNATVVSGATTNYNCHSYAWYSQSTSNVYWMNDPGKYMSDGSYTQVGTSPTATSQKVCYTQYPLVNPYIHSGIVYSISGSTVKLTSKWGAGPLVRHNVSYSPYGGTPIYFKR